MSVKFFSIRAFAYILDIALSYFVFIQDPIYFAEHEANPFAAGALHGNPISIIGFFGLFFLYLLLFVYIVSYSKETIQKYQKYFLTAFVVLVLFNGFIAPLTWFWSPLVLAWEILYRIELLLLLLGWLFPLFQKKSEKSLAKDVEVEM